MRNNYLKTIGTTIVTGIDDDERDSIFEISIPKGIKKIGKNAFEYCESLQIVKIPNTVTEIGKGAFNNCTSLQMIKIPKSVMKLLLFCCDWCYVS